MSQLAQVQMLLGERLIEMDMLRMEIQALRYVAQRERWQERFAALAVFALVGAVVGLLGVTHGVR